MAIFPSDEKVATGSSYPLMVAFATCRTQSPTVMREHPLRTSFVIRERSLNFTMNFQMATTTTSRPGSVKKCNRRLTLFISSLFGPTMTIGTDTTQGYHEL